MNAARVGTTSAVFVGIAVYLPAYFASGFLFYGQFVANLDTPLEALAALAVLQCVFLLLAWHISKMQISVDDPTWSPAYRERVKANLERIKAEREAERPRDMRIFRRMSAMACVIFMVAYALGR